MKRTDIERKDVFLSWTGADRELKNKIKDYLESHGITCLESDEGCSGDFRQWSREAVSSCNVFLPILTENTFGSTFVPIEIEEYKRLPDFENRIVPVAASLEVYRREPWGIGEYASAVFTDAEGWLDAMLHKVESLVINLLDRIYTEATEPDYLRLIPLYRGKGIRDGQYGHSSLYVPRSITEDDGTVLATPDELVKEAGLYFISGPAGCGKTSYIDEIRHAAESGTVVMSLPCYKIVKNDAPVEEVMFEELVRLCGQRCFYTKEDFYRLLDLRRLVLIIDGMDEVPGEANTRRLLKKVEDYYCTANNVSLIFTSRNPGDADLISMKGSAPRRFTLDKLTDEQIRRLSSNLFILFGTEDKNESFYVGIKELNDEIKTNPLLISQLALIYRDSGRIPDTVVGIYDAVSEMTLTLDTFKEITEIPDSYLDMMRGLGGLLKAFAKERYVLLSKGRSVEAERIFSRILKDKYGDESRERAVFLVDYLQNRAIMSDGEFYHKMFLEYFTAVYFYEHSFDDYDELEDTGVVGELLEHYTDPFWSAVIKMYLVKADSLIDADMTRALYYTVLSFGIKDYTLLFDTCRDLIRHRDEAEIVILEEIVERSATGEYSPYGVMFWYASQYDLAESMLLTLVRMKSKEYFPKALALVRDAVFLFTESFTVADVTDKVSGKELFDTADAGLSGARRGLCELFCLGTTECAEGDDIYPRCFNVREAKAFMETGSGVRGRMNTPFEDELGLYSHTAIPEHNGEYIGIATADYGSEMISRTLNSKPCTKLCGLFLSPTDDTFFDYMAFDRASVKVLYVPENSEELLKHCTNFMPLVQSFSLTEGGLRYVKLTLRIAEGEGIGDKEFKGCISLKRVMIDDGVKSIGTGAFYDCVHLERVYISDTVEYLGDAAFWNCLNLSSVRLSGNIREISSGTFGHCVSLENIIIPDRVARIGTYAFLSCISLTSVVIPANVTAIECNTFEGCFKLAEVKLPDNLKVIDDNAFCACSELKTISLPNGVEKLGRSVFIDCSSLEEIVIPCSVMSIGEAVFVFCQSLKRVILPRRFEGEIHTIGIEKSVETIFTDVCDETVEEVSSIDFDSEEIAVLPSQFAYLRSLKKVSLPDNIKYIGSSAFRGCENLRKVLLPRTLVQIGANAFQGCSSLETIEIMSVITIGEDAFKGCTSLKRIILPVIFKDNLAYIGIECGTEVEFTGENKEFRPNFGINRIEPYEYKYSQALGIVIIPDGVCEICTSAFAYSSITTVTLPNGLTEIGNEAFAKCGSLKTIEFSDTLKAIGDHAFSYCCIESLDMPDSVRKIGMEAFSNCRKLRSVNVGKRIKVLAEGVFRNCIELTRIFLNDGVTEIAFQAFYACKKLQRIALPETLTRIGREAFIHCSGLSEIIIPDSVTELCSGAFMNCTSLEKVRLSQGLTELAYRVFENCSSLRSVSIPDSVSTISENAFKKCGSLKSVILPEGLTVISASLFEDCSSLELEVLPDDLAEISRCAFKGCSSIERVTVPSSVYYIGESAFENCSSLESIELGHGLRNIGDNAFAGCTGLKKVRISSNFKNDIKRIFGDIDPDVIKYI